MIGDGGNAGGAGGSGGSGGGAGGAGGNGGDGEYQSPGLIQSLRMSVRLTRTLDVSDVWALPPLAPSGKWLS